MKILILYDENIILSLENMRKVELHTSTSKHTKMGKPYTVTEYCIWIDYTDGHSERIECGEDTEGKEKADSIFQRIITVLIQ